LHDLGDLSLTLTDDVDSFGLGVSNIKHLFGDLLLAAVFGLDCDKFSFTLTLGFISGLGN